MSERALAFVESWVSENIRATAGQPIGDDSRAQALAAQCRSAADAEGISPTEIDEAFDNLTTFIAGEMEEARDREAARLAEQDAEKDE